MYWISLDFSLSLSLGWFNDKNRLKPHSNERKSEPQNFVQLFFIVLRAHNVTFAFAYLFGCRDICSLPSYPIECRRYFFRFFFSLHFRFRLFSCYRLWKSTRDDFDFFIVLNNKLSIKMNLLQFVIMSRKMIINWSRQSVWRNNMIMIISRQDSKFKTKEIEIFFPIYC